MTWICISVDVLKLPNEKTCSILGCDKPPKRSFATVRIGESIAKAPGSTIYLIALSVLILIHLSWFGFPFPVIIPFIVLNCLVITVTIEIIPQISILQKKILRFIYICSQISVLAAVEGHRIVDFAQKVII